MRSSPISARLEFSLRVRNRRRSLGIPAEQISKELKFSRVYYSSIENSRAVLSEGKLPQLAKALSFNPVEARELHGLLKLAKESNWWSSYSDIIADEYQETIGLEDGAKSIRIYESRLMTGLLQTEGYMRALAGASPEVRRADIGRIVELRNRRQEILDHSDSFHLEVVLGEAVTRQQIGGPEVHLLQLQRVVDEIEKEPQVVRVRIEPFTATPHGFSTAGTVVLFEFESEHMPTVAWREAGELFALDHDPEVVRRLLLHYEQTLTSTLDEEASLELLKQRIVELEAEL